MELEQQRLRRPLITGAGGFIGSNLARRLALMPQTEIVYCVDLPNSPGLKSLEEMPKVTCIFLDLNNDSAHHDLPDDVTSVFAMAALNGTSRFYTSPFSVFRGSLVPTINTLLKYSTIAPIVYSSSSEVYASTVTRFNAAIPTDELVVPSIQDIHNPRWSYASAKLAGEVAVNSASVEFNALTAIVRYHNVYGPNMGPGHFVSDFITRASNGIFEVIGAEETRAFIHISDVIEGTIAAMLVADGRAEVFHLGSNEEFSIETAAKLILTEMKMENSVLIRLPSRLGSVERRLADSSKALRILKWQAKVNFKEGIKDYLTNTLPY